ncbi:MAG: hypothetical protein FWE80_09410 [Oscillospiraceae bacterium]|nr:hypothetical protein [Oscillospiraceae bacterium]
MADSWTDYQHEDWFGGVYSNDGSVENLTYVIVRGREHLLPPGFLENHICVFKKYSRNELLRVQNEIVGEWFIKEGEWEKLRPEVFMQSIGANDMTNRLEIEIYIDDAAADCEEVTAIKQALYGKYGDMIKISTTRYRAQTSLGYAEPAEYSLIWPIAAGTAIIAAMFCIWRIRLSRQPVMQTAAGHTVTVYNTTATEKAVTAAVETPGDGVWARIINAVETHPYTNAPRLSSF